MNTWVSYRLQTAYKIYNFDPNFEMTLILVWFHKTDFTRILINHTAMVTLEDNNHS